MSPPRLPWVRLYREESPRFQRLSIFARAIHAELLKVTDHAGVVHIANGKPHLGVARLIGAARGDRKKLGLVLAELLKSGYLEHDPEASTLTFPRFKERQKSATRALKERRKSATTSPKSTESLGSPLELELDRELDRELELTPPTPQGEIPEEKRCVTKSRHSQSALPPTDSRPASSLGSAGSPTELSPSPTDSGGGPSSGSGTPASASPSRSPRRSTGSKRKRATKVETELEITTLAARYDRGTIDRCRAGATEHGDSATAWRNTLRWLAERPEPIVTAALRTYAEKHAGEKPGRYIHGIVRGEMKRANSVTKGAVDAALARPGQEHGLKAFTRRAS